MNRVVVYARVDPEVKGAAQASAEERGMSLSRYVNRALERQTHVDELIRDGKVPSAEQIFLQNLSGVLDAALKAFDEDDN